MSTIRNKDLINMIANYINSKPDGYLYNCGNIVNDLNLRTKTLDYDKHVSYACSDIFQKQLLKKPLGITIELVGKSPLYSRNGKRPGNLYKVNR